MAYSTEHNVLNSPMLKDVLEFPSHFVDELGNLLFLNSRKEAGGKQLTKQMS